MLSLKRAATASTLVAAVAASFTLSACSTEDDTFEGIPVFPVDAPAVTVVEAGKDPRPLAYTDATENEENVEENVTVAVSAGIDQSTVEGGSEVETRAPAGGDVNTTTLPLTVRVSPAPAPGADEVEATRQVDFEVGAGKHTDLEIGQDVASAEGFLMRWRAENSGQISTLQLLAPQGAQPRGLQLVEPALLSLVSANVVLPTEPVGTGGIWTVKNRVAGDATMLRTTTYTVTAIDGDTVTLDVKVDEEPSTQSVEIDNDAAGELDGKQVNVESSSTTSEGQIVVDLTKPLPVSGQVAATTRLIYAGEGQRKVVQDITHAVKYGD